MRLVRKVGLCWSMFACGCAATAALAEVTVKDAWVRATVPAQKSTGAFGILTSTEDARLVAAASPLAKVVEVHLSEMKGGVMQMRAVDFVALPAGKPVELRPGGYHVMLMGLAKPVSAGEQVPIVLTIENTRGERSKLEVKAAVRPIGSR